MYSSIGDVISCCYSGMNDLRQEVKISEKISLPMQILFTDKNKIH